MGQSAWRWQGLGALGGSRGGKVVGVSEEELVKLQDDADRREKQLKNQVTGQRHCAPLCLLGNCCPTTQFTYHS